MMIVMVRHEHAQINEAHRRPQTWMNRRSGENRAVGSHKESHELAPEGPELGEEIHQPAGVVIRLVRATIREIRRRELRLTSEDLLRTAQPQRLQVNEMPDVLLHRPAAVVSSGEHGRRKCLRTLLEPCRRTAQPFKQAGKAADR